MYIAKSGVRFKFKNGRVLNCTPYEKVHLTKEEIEELGQYLFNLFFSTPRC